MKKNILMTDDTNENTCDVTRSLVELMSAKDMLLDSLATMIEYRSLETGEHIRHIKELTGILVNQLMQHPKYGDILKTEGCATIEQAAAMHDLGKIGIPDHILLKPGRLSPEEFMIIETHSVIGSEMISTMMADKEDKYLQHCYDIARHHHERWDGKGYPDGLAGENIPLSARIVAIVDVYDALVSERCYKRGMTHEEAIEIINKEAGIHFDAVIVAAMKEVEDQVCGIYRS